MKHPITRAPLSGAGLLAVVAALALAAPASAQAEFTGAGQTTDLDCGGKTAAIVGASNEMTISGDCQLLTIEGASNRVHVAMAKNGLIRVTGASNEIHWTTPDGSKPRLQITGADNRVAKAK